MAQLTKLLESLSLKQKVSIGVAAIVVIAAMYGFVHWHHEQDFKPLYTGVAAEDAAAIIQKIKESGSEYRLSETGGVISVPSSRVAELRLELAAAGLPRTGRIGFELFDKTNFGATEFVEHVNYNRALEGELERSIATLNPVEQARVHLTAAKDSVFVESREPAKASVVVKLKIGSALTPRNVTAIQQLVSSAVEGLDGDDVSVVDTRGNLLSKRKLSAQDDSSDAVFERKQRIERDLLDKVNNTLEPLLGRDKFRAAVTVDCDLTSAEQSEETYDPTKSVMTNSKKSEEVTTSNSGAGIPGTASNLPRPAVRAGAPSNMTTRRSEDISYESSHIVRKTHIPDGGLKRMSVSVLLDQHVRWEGKGKGMHLVPVPPTPETIKAVHDLVAGVTGFVQERGDQVTIESLPFEATLAQVSPEGAPALPDNAKPGNWKDILKDRKILMISIGALAILALAGAGAFVFMRRRKRAKSGEDEDRVTGQANAIEGAEANSEIAPAKTAGELEAAEQHDADMAAIAALKLPAVTTRKSELLTNEIRESTKKDPSVSAHVIQTWLRES
jgi:flagellar M-ring protein FliF